MIQQIANRQTLPIQTMSELRTAWEQSFGLHDQELGPHDNLLAQILEMRQSQELESAVDFCIELLDNKGK